ncbi:MAG: PA14 domain-containing protein, partial [Pseudomonadota bacterium]
FSIDVADANEAPSDIQLTQESGSLSLNQDGGTDDNAISADMSNFPTDAITVEVSFAADAAPQGSGAPLFSYSAGGSGGNDVLLWAESSSGKLCVFLDGQKFQTDIDNADLFDGEEHTVAFTWDADTGDLVVYIDGEAEYSRSVSVSELNADGTVTLGQEQDSEGGSYDSNQVFQGEIGEVRIYEEALTEEQIAGNADGSVTQDGLVTHWQMDQATDGVVTDLVGDNDLVLENGAEITGSGDADAITVVENTPGAVIGTLSSTDPDAGDTVTYSVSDDRFEVVDGELRLADGVSLDHEDAASVDITVTATDSAGLSSQETFTIDVADVNEGPSDLAIDNTTVAENDAGAVVGTLSSFDPDAGDSVSYAVSDDRFEVVDGELRLADGVSLDHEEAATIEVTVSATDESGLSTEETFSIDVADVNEAPSDVALSSDQGAFLEQEGLLVIEAENYDASAEGSGGHAWGESDSEGMVHVDDGANAYDMWRGESDVENDAPELTYSIQIDTPGTYYVHIRGDAEDGPSGNADSVHIGIDGERLSGDGGITGFGRGDDWGSTDTYTGQVVAITFDEAGTYDLNLWAREDGVSVDQIVLTQDPNFDPSAETLTESPRVGDNGVIENEVGATVGTITAFDPDAGDSITYTVSDDRFEVVDGELKLADDVSLDFEEASSIEVTVTATDNQGLSSEETFSIDVADVNEAPSSLEIDGASVAENDAGAVIGTLSSFDPDAGDSISYTVSDDRFEVVDGEVRLADGVSLSYEEAASVDITVTATDSGGLETTETFTVDVIQDNASPTLGISSTNGLTASYYDIGHSLSNLDQIDFDAAPDATAIVGSLDHMTGNEAFWEGGPNNHFAAKYEGQLVVEEGGTYTINLASDDGSVLYINGEAVLDNDGLHGTRTRTVTLDLEEGAHDIEVRYFENGGSQTLQMSWSGPDTDGEMQVIDGSALQTGPTLESLSIAEDTEGAIVAVLTVSDPDEGDQHTFQVDDDRFEVVDIDGEPTLKLKDGQSIDFETSEEVSVNVTVLDGNGASDTLEFNIAVEDTNAAPEIYTPGDEGLTASYYDIGHSLSNLDQIDFDAAPDATAIVGSLDHMTGNEAFWEGGPNNHFAAKYEGQLVVEEGGTYTINLASDDGSVLYINGEAVLDNDGLHGTRTRTVTLDLEEGAHDIEVRYFENGGSQTLQMSWSGPDTDGEMQVIDGSALRQPGTFESEGFALAENVSGDIVTLLGARDSDGDAVILSVDDDRFEIAETDEGTALKLKDGVSLDYEADASLEVTVTATDAHGESSSETFSIDVTDVDDAPTVTTEASTETKTASVENAEITTGNGGGVATSTVMLGEVDSDTAAITIDFAQIDNSLEIEINGQSLTDETIQLQANAFDDSSDVMLVFEDGSVANSPWVPNSDGSPRFQVVVTDEGVEIYGTRSPGSGEMEPMTLEGGSFNSIDLSEGENTVTVTNPDGPGPDGLSATVSGTYDEVVETTTITGTEFNDTIVGGADDEIMIGGDGDDMFIYAEDGGSDTIDGGAGWTDTIDLSGALGDDAVYDQDWTLTVTEGEVVSEDADSITLSDDASGFITLDNGETIDFSNIEQIGF